MFGIATRQRAEEGSEPEPPSLGEDVRIRLEADFAEDGSFGHRVLEVTREHVRVLESGDAPGDWPHGLAVPAFQMPIAEIKSARNEPLIGGGRLEILAKTGEVIPIITYSLTL